jgi:WD40 repeat protein
MSSESSQPSSREQRLHEAIAAYLGSIEAGQAQDRADLLARHPDLAAELKAFFTGHDQVQRVAGPMRLVPAGGQRPATVLEQPALQAQGDGAIPASGTGGRPPQTIIEPQTIPPRDAISLAPEDSPPPAFGDYELLTEIGRGGVGIVYQARQVSLNRLVALKMILAGGQAGPEELLRFRAEAETIARLRHPNIVQIHAVGEHEGRPYLALEFIEAGSLFDRLDGTPWPPQLAARLVEKLAGAMQAVHEQGIVHRDLKPANVLLAEEGLPKITDFGLAKRLDDAAGPTQTGAILGTPSYMAPEQAAGAASRRQAGAVRVGPEVDIYALGAILYELLTGRPPFKAATPLDTLLQVLADDPVPPRRLHSKVPRALETICLKCLHKEPNKRYTSGKALAEDLGRFLQGRPIVARPVGVLSQGVRWVRRRPAAATLLVLMVLIPLGLVAGGAWYLHERELDRRIDEEREKQREQMEEVAYVHLISLAQRACDEKDKERAKTFLDQCPRRLRRWEYHYLRRLAEDRGGDKCGIDLPALAKSGVSCLALSPDGKRLASGSGKFRGKPGEVKVWDAATGQQTLSLGWHTELVRSVAFTPDGKRLASGSNDGTVKVWDAATGHVSLTLQGHTGQVLSVAFSPDGQRLASGGGELGKPGEVKVWDAATGQLALTLQGHTLPVDSVAFSPDAKRLASASLDKTVKVWDAATGQESLTLKGHTGPVFNVAFSPDGKRLASASQLWDAQKGTLVGGEVKVWDAATGQESLTLKGQTGPVVSVAFSPDGNRLASGGGVWDGPKHQWVSGEVKVWDAATGQQTRTLQAHTGEVCCVAFSPDGKRLASAGAGVKVWDAATGQESLTLNWQVFTVAFSPDGQRLASASYDGTVMVWDAATGRESLTLKGQTGPVLSVAFSPDGKRLASGSGGWDAQNRQLGELKVWDAATGQQTLTLKGHTGQVSSVAFSPDGKRLASASFDQTVKVWDAATGQESLTLEGHTGPVVSVAFSPDGKRLASGGGELGKPGEVKVWDAATGHVSLTLQGHTGQVLSVAFSPDAKRLASGSWDGTVKVWDAATGQETLTLKGHTGSVAFSPDGKRLASVSVLWDAQTGEELIALPNPGGLSHVIFSPDGNLLVGYGDGRLQVWDGTPLE